MPHPTGSSNTTGTVTLNNITATDDVRIDTRQGDVLLSGTVRSWNGAVALNAVSYTHLLSWRAAIGADSLATVSSKACTYSGARRRAWPPAPAA